MKIEKNLVKEMTIEKFAELHDLTMEINERPDTTINMRFYAEFKYTELIIGNGLRSAFGNGKTIEEAIQEYAENISLRKIAVYAYKTYRKNIDVPRLVAK